ncbi:glyoxalase [Modestobacter sp. I12A-02628]|uniref:Glyoxalase n=1 Tax=Goekera deserti TaxID=2497753 RepID=A0A7K3WAY2_9ACTN|nr:VOC family protein [Goekera deserti]MPQ98853.1 glyoxalase [Goekera deserti]NDI49648.1 glyoxalase [Goekera deserti]NEL53159.1 glyoxalase [Goekera deserti]
MTAIFINLQVRDAQAARTFWNGLGYPTDEKWADERTSNATISEHIVLMLLETERFADFVTGPVADAAAGTRAIYCLSADSREAVDALADKALASGGGDWQPAQDHGFMYGRSFTDPDGHVWEVMHMDLSAVPSGDGEQLAGAPA